MRDPKQDKIDKAQQLKNILSNPVMENLWLELESKYVEAWRKTDRFDIDERERLFIAINILEDIEKHFQQIINDADFTVKFKFS
tara:strand:+ start:989 stop:1240 length:252 start_codon:yes stop_codon:yes gene_type:complete